MKTIYQNILHQIAQGEKLLAVLIDPDKMQIDHIESFFKKVNLSSATHVFVGGSTVEEGTTDIVVAKIKQSI